MAQTKKEPVRNHILTSAYKLFKERGYSSTTMANIADKSGVSTSNIYSYFSSKIDVLMSIYDPILERGLSKLAREVAAEPDVRQRLRTIFLAILRDLPSERNKFANNVVQAVATDLTDKAYSRTLLLRSEEKLSEILKEALPNGARFVATGDLLSHLLFMAFDGFAIHYKRHGVSRRVEHIADLLCDLIMTAAKYDELLSQESGDPTAWQ